MKIRPVRAFVFGLLIGVSVWALRAQAQSNLPLEVIRYADSVLYNGKILTGDKDFTVVEAVAVRDGKFIARGKADYILTMAGPNTRRIDLKGKTATPGLYDLHGGPGGGAFREYWEDRFLPNEPSWRTTEDALAGIKKAVSRAQPGEIINIVRYVLDMPVDTNVGGRGGFLFDLITREELDALSPNNPIFFPGGVNNTVMGMNSAAAEISNRFLPKGVTTPFVKDGSWAVAAGADLDGILLPGQQSGNDVAFWVVPADDEKMLEYWKEEINKFVAAGVTLGKQHMAVPFFNALRELWERGELNMRFRMPAFLVPQISGHTVELPEGEDAEAFFRRWGNMSHLGDNMLRLAGMRIPAVGGNVMGGDAWMLNPKTRPYPDRWGNASPYGGRIQEQEAVERGDKNTFRARDILIQATRFGWDVSCDHCIGDRGIREVVKAWEEAKQDMIVNRRTQRLTTNHTPMAHSDDIKKMAELGVWSSISTGHSFGGGAQSKDLDAALWWAGTEHLNSWSPIKSYVTAGSHPSLEGTMWSWGPRRGIEGEGFTGRSAFFWIAKAITRKDEKYGRAWNPAEALSRQEALWAATLWSAEQLAEDKELGSMEVGKEADLVIIDRDYMTVPADDIQNTQVLLTMVGGKIVYEKPRSL